MTKNFLPSFFAEIAFNISADNLRIRSDQIRARLRLYPVMLSSQAFLEPLCVALFWDYAEHQYLLLWLSFMYTLHAVDLTLWWHNHKKISSIQECRQWDIRFKIFTSLTALTWGSFTLIFFPQNLALLALLICVVLGLVAGAVTLDSVYPPSLYIYVFGVTVPMISRLIMVTDQTHLLLTGMLLLFLSGALSAGRELSKTFWKSLWQRYENDNLIKQLTEQKAIAETANREKSHFLASASHDLRQPLQALVLFSEALQDASRDKKTLHLSSQIGKSVGALVDMFDELLDISKFDAGVIQKAVKHFKPQDLFERLKADFIHLANDKDLELVVNNTQLVAFSDPHLIERILRNLIANAIRYTDIGKVTVSCENVDNLLQFSVQDTGIGIEAEDMPHIFEEYYQVNNQQRDRIKGLGLGLAIVRRMALLLESQVTVVSEPTQGSKFSFSVNQGHASYLEKILAPQLYKHDLRGVTVALVEDNSEIRQMTAELLKQWGCHVYEGELAHNVLRQMASDGNDPDILISDYRLTQKLTAIDGIKLLRTLWDKNIPALVLTGDTAPETLQEIKASGALLLHKPIAPARLRSILYFAINKTLP